MAQEQQKRYDEPPALFHDQGRPLLGEVDEIELPEKPATQAGR